MSFDSSRSQQEPEGGGGGLVLRGPRKRATAFLLRPSSRKGRVRRHLGGARKRSGSLSVAFSGVAFSLGLYIYVFMLSDHLMHWFVVFILVYGLLLYRCLRTFWGWEEKPGFVARMKLGGTRKRRGSFCSFLVFFLTIETLNTIHRVQNMSWLSWDCPVQNYRNHRTCQ